MEPVEINAGTYYLRQLRTDEFIDDRPALVETFADEETVRYRSARIPDLAAASEYIALRAEQWRSDQRYSWAVANQTTGELLAELTLTNLAPRDRFAEITCWTHPAHRGNGIVVATIPAVLRFGFGALDLHHVSYQHAVSNTASRRVAEKCGFLLDGRMREAYVVDGVAEDRLVWSRLSTDED
ncbi:GNAT family N-acetyltransferase [Tamaricihabitans halophyticus]|uniref:GNAT family N-acetyltransferase n=1 Tax=Tamaricihabitans halophyticus TaxID=1262583 RepID=UPI001046CBE4|nr:GNAT family N-acetyltransferase [Tamaricihabitans halophyticus]